MELVDIPDYDGSDCTDSESDYEAESGVSEAGECVDAGQWNKIDEMPLSKRIKSLDGIWVDETREFHVPEFQEACGPDIPANSCSTPTKTFQLFFSKDLIDLIVSQTNLYFEQSGKRFQKTDAIEIQKFIGINLLMGIKKQPSYRDYWSSDSRLSDAYIQSVMSVKRFSLLLSHIHLVDNTLEPKKGEQTYDKLYKIRPLLETLSENFKRYYKPSRKQSIDESMIKFKGRSSMKQYMPGKPTNRGYKVWVRADEHGFVSRFQIYTGKTGGTPEKSLGAKVVKALTSDLKDLYYEIYFDNYFTSVDLMISLRENGILACGTVRKDRVGLPKIQKNDKDMKVGDYQYKTSVKGLAWVKWIDKKPVQFLSNFHDPSIVKTCMRKQKDGTIKSIPAPELVNDYNKNMGFVDKSDMLKSTYEISRKSKKWWHRIFWHFVDLTVVNAHIIYKQVKDTNVVLKDFRLSVVQGLIGITEKKKVGRKNAKPVKRLNSSLDSSLRTTENKHMPIYQKKRRRCAHCSSKNKEKKTQFICKTCDIGLCIDERNCFLKFHE